MNQAKKWSIKSVKRRFYLAQLAMLKRMTWASTAHPELHIFEVSKGVVKLLIFPCPIGQCKLRVISRFWLVGDAFLCRGNTAIHFLKAKLFYIAKIKAKRWVSCTHLVRKWLFDKKFMASKHAVLKSGQEVTFIAFSLFKITFSQLIL